MELIALIGPVVVMVLTQALKKVWTGVTPLLVAAILSIGGGLGYAVLMKYGYFDALKDFSLIAFSGSVAIFEVLKKIGIIK